MTKKAMRLFFALILLFFIRVVGFSQGTIAGITNLAGFDLTTGDLVITSSIGEPAILTLANDSWVITQGLLQPEELPCEGITISYFPNPTPKEITVRAIGCYGDVRQVQIIDVQGRPIASLVPDEEDKVNLQDIGDGIYFLKLMLNNNTSQFIKIIKALR